MSDDVLRRGHGELEFCGTAVLNTCTDCPFCQTRNWPGPVIGWAALEAFARSAVRAMLFGPYMDPTKTFVGRATSECSINGGIEPLSHEALGC